MISPVLKVSLGNKLMGTISFVAIILLALAFVLPYFRWETLLVGGLLILVYSLQATMIRYISLGQRQFFIENIFRPVVQKDASLFDEVTELVPFTHLMRIKFKDGSSYLFWGKSEIELNQSIRRALQD